MIGELDLSKYVLTFLAGWHNIIAWTATIVHSFIDIAGIAGMASNKGTKPKKRGINMEKMTRKVKVSGGPGRDAKVDSVVIDVTIDYTNVSRDELLKRAFAHDVVRVQNGTLRDGTNAEWKEWSEKGYQVAAETIGSGKRAPVDPIAASLRKAATMTPEQIQEFIEKLEAAKAAKTE